MVHQKDETETFQYFAIGSMLNPMSLKLRGIRPITSVPAELLNHRIGFFTSIGVAVPIPEDGASMHGVIHTLTKSDMDALDSLEQALHTRISAIAKFYDGSQVTVGVYTRNETIKDSTLNDAPYERYVEIMITGCEHYGVDPNYIEYLRSIKKTPRPSPDSYLTFDVPKDPNKYISLDEVYDNNGLDGKPLYMTMNKKVLHLLPTIPDTDFRFLQENTQRMGPIGDLLMSRLAYDPKFGLPQTLSDVTPEQAAYFEHNMCTFLQMKGIFHYFDPIAYLQVGSNQS